MLKLHSKFLFFPQKQQFLFIKLINLSLSKFFNFLILNKFLISLFKFNFSFLQFLQIKLIGSFFSSNLFKIIRFFDCSKIKFRTQSEQKIQPH